jgi:hypothetical protein
MGIPRGVVARNTESPGRNGVQEGATRGAIGVGVGFVLGGSG